MKININICTARGFNLTVFNWQVILWNPLVRSQQFKFRQWITRDTNIDYQQLWAQAKTWYDAGEQWYLSDAELSMLNQHNEKFMVTDPDVEALLEYFPFFGCNLWTKKTMRNICTDLDLNTPTKSQTMKLAQAILKHNGGQRPFESNGVKYHWVPDKFSIIQAAKATHVHPVPPSVAPVAP